MEIVEIFLSFALNCAKNGFSLCFLLQMPEVQQFPRNNKFQTPKQVPTRNGAFAGTWGRASTGTQT